MTIANFNKTDILLKASLIFLIGLVIRLVFLDGYKILGYYFDLKSNDGSYHSWPISGINVLYYGGYLLFEVIILIVAVFGLFNWTKIISLILVALLIPFFLQFAIPQMEWFIKYNTVNWVTVASIVVIALLVLFVLKKNRQENISFDKKDFILLTVCSLFFCCFIYCIVYVYI